GGGMPGMPGAALPTEPGGPRLASAAGDEWYYAQLPGMPGMPVMPVMPGMTGATPGGHQGGWGQSHIQTGKGAGQTADGQSGDMVDKLLKVAERFDTPPSLDKIKVNVLGPDNVSFTAKANDDKGLGEIAFRVYDTQGNAIGEQLLTGLGKKWEGTTQPIKTGGGSFIVIAQAKDTTGNTSKEQRASFTMSGAPLQPAVTTPQPAATTSEIPVATPDQPAAVPTVPAVTQEPQTSIPAPPIPTPAPVPSEQQGLPAIAEPVIFSNGNIAGVQNGPSRTTSFTIQTPHRVTFIYNYHYFNNGRLPGTIALRHSDGTLYGPWQTEGALGQGGVKNAYWFVRPNADIKAGTYTVVDSDPSTWSHNSGSAGAGFTEIRGLATN
ncbi:MAG TPA: hypothetical protein PLN25_03675, partial [Deltaproteobacteria bacterium]|nr:hypothetical protein [Deltaproteobacteria bacterium]